MNNIQKIIKIQSLARGWIVRHHNTKSKDKMTKEIMRLLLENYNNKIILNREINKSLPRKKIRNDNFPSEISENIVKFAFLKKYNIMPSWDTRRGDLYVNVIKKQIEVKAFSSDGPSSFGPNEEWDMIYFVDCRDHLDNKFIVYEINLSNNDKIWKNIKINKTQTFSSQCKEKRRPRICFSEIKKQLDKHCRIIFDGKFDEL